MTSRGTVLASWNGERIELGKNQRVANWTLMATCQTGAGRRQAVFEDFSQFKGEILFIGDNGEEVRLPKSLEPTYAEPGTLCRGHSLEEVFRSERGNKSTSVQGELKQGRAPAHVKIPSARPKIWGARQNCSTLKSNIFAGARVTPQLKAGDAARSAPVPGRSSVEMWSRLGNTGALARSVVAAPG